MDFIFKSAAVALLQSFLSSVYNIAIEPCIWFLTLIPLLVRILIFFTFFTLNNMGHHYLIIYLMWAQGNACPCFEQVSILNFFLSPSPPPPPLWEEIQLRRDDLIFPRRLSLLLGGGGSVSLQLPQNAPILLPIASKVIKLPITLVHSINIYNVFLVKIHVDLY